MLIRFDVPEDVDFSDLHLRRTSDGGLEFDWSPIRRICAESNIDFAALKYAPADNIVEMLLAWYRAHRDSGGEPNAVADDLAAEAQAIDELGGGFSYPPGHA
jgi:hypothetical protein